MWICPQGIMKRFCLLCVGVADVFIVIFYLIVLDFALICSHCYCFPVISHFYNTLPAKCEQGSLLVLVSKFHI